MKKRKEKEFKIRTYLTGIIWLALACSMIISALLFAFLKHFLEMPEVFAPQPLIYKVKREQPASKKQKEVLRELLKYHRINLSAQIDSLSKNEISRLTDQIIAQHGRMQKR